MSATPSTGPGAATIDATPEGGQHPLRRAGRVVMQVLWPAFLMAIIAEGVFFSLIDPHELRVVAAWLNGSRIAAYTIAFFVFWVLFACSSGIKYFLARGVDDGPARSD